MTGPAPSIEPCGVDLRELVRAMPQICATTIQHSGIALAQDIPDQPLPVVMRRSRLELLLMHLVAVASHAMPNGGTLRVLALRDGTQAVLQFVDEWSGVSPRLAEVFHRESVRQSHRARGESTRNSVNQCLQIAREHCGRIYAAPSVRGGLGVTLRLPLAADALRGTMGSRILEAPTA